MNGYMGEMEECRSADEHAGPSQQGSSNTREIDETRRDETGRVMARRMEEDRQKDTHKRRQAQEEVCCGVACGCMVWMSTEDGW
jgi:hypothetical protein